MVLVQMLVLAAVVVVVVAVVAAVVVAAPCLFHQCSSPPCSNTYTCAQTHAHSLAPS